MTEHDASGDGSSLLRRRRRVPLCRWLAAVRESRTVGLEPPINRYGARLGSKSRQSPAATVCTSRSVAYVDDLYLGASGVQLGTRELDALKALRVELDRSSHGDEVPIAAEVATVTELEVKAAFLLWSGLWSFDADDGHERKAIATFRATLGDRHGDEDPAGDASREIALVLWLRRTKFSESARDELIRWLDTLGLDAGVHRRVVEVYLAPTP